MAPISRLMLAGSLILAVEPAIAVPPPPPPLGYEASWGAIDKLNPLVGHWTGEEVQHVVSGNGKSADFPRPRYLNIERPEGRDLLIVEGGSNNRPSHAEFTNVITFDPQARSYELYMPGYRVFSGSSKTSALVPMIKGADGHLSWSIARDDGASNRISVWHDGKTLHERQELVRADGSVIDEADAAFAKSDQ